MFRSFGCFRSFGLIGLLVFKIKQLFTSLGLLGLSVFLVVESVKEWMLLRCVGTEGLDTSTLLWV